MKATKKENISLNSEDDLIRFIEFQKILLLALKKIVNNLEIQHTEKTLQKQKEK